MAKILKLNMVVVIAELGFVLLALQACGGHAQVNSDAQSASLVSMQDNQVSYRGKTIGVLPDSLRLKAQKELESAGYFPKLPDGVLVPEITRLKDGRIWLSGGVGANNTYSCNTWFFDPKTKQLIKGPRLAKESIKHSTLLLPDGKVLVSGGSTARPVEIELVQLMDPKTNSIVNCGKLIFARYEHSMVEIAPGVIAITGGATRNGDQDEVEIFDLNLAQSRMVGHLMGPRKQHDSLKIDSNHIMVLRGRGFEYKEKELEPEVFVIPENK